MSARLSMSKFLDIIREHEYLETFSSINKEVLYEQVWKFIQNRPENKAIIDIFHNNDRSYLFLNVQDMPFIVDSIRMALSKFGNTVYSFMNIADLNFERADSVLKDLDSNSKAAVSEALLIVEIDYIQEEHCTNLKNNIAAIVDDVILAVKDWRLMQNKMSECIDNIRDLHGSSNSFAQESQEFLEWLKQHFTFFGFRKYDRDSKSTDSLILRNDSALGVLQSKDSDLAGYAPSSDITPYKPNTVEQFVVVGKSKYRSSIHRPVYTDVIVVRLQDSNNNLVSEYRFFGLFTSNAYESDPMVIPFLKHKSEEIINLVTKRITINEGYTLKKVKQFIRSIPRDELFQSDISYLTSVIHDALALQNNTSIKVSLRKDKFKRFVSILLFIPQNNHSHNKCKEIDSYLRKTFQADESAYQTTLLDLEHVCVNFVLRIDENKDSAVDIDKIKMNVLLLAQTWDNIFVNRLNAQGISNKGYLFTSNYKEMFDPDNAVQDLKFIEQLSEAEPIKVSMRYSSETGYVHIRSYQWKQSLSLSEALPIFENLGFELKHEVGAGILNSDKLMHWVSEFTASPIVSIEKDELCLENIVNSFYKVHSGDSSNDSFNQLGLRAGLNWYEVRVIRAIANYLKQVGFSLSVDYISQTLNQYPQITEELIKLFRSKFALNETASTRDAIYEQQLVKLHDVLESVLYVDEDKVFRGYMSVIGACVRTNAYKLDKNGKKPSYVSFKLHSADVIDIPLPAPKFEIFTFSHRFMGVHLRADMVARGGLRWSDREDFRKEVLDLMKAQQVKNSLIVPAGAKGGFVLRRNLSNMSVKEVHEEATTCYRLFISSLLDLTHNLVKGKLIAPDQVVCHDPEDSYLVVAADKGTSTFSDIANEISEHKFNFWLKDAFATGGSKGYDHKKMGITSRGAWESVKWHFREMQDPIDTRAFTVVGIGGMAGDVFGNGMLLSKNIKLVAAFNHKFLFIDPNPDPAKSYKERQRLFVMEDSMWSDYDSSLISEGGGVFSRFDKLVPLSKQAAEVLDIVHVDKIAPTELIKAMLKAPVDLIWNGGIGTYVKSSAETDADVGDHANDRLRINGANLRCKIFGEGGNLGMTQLSRAEAEFSGVRLNTDFIDNSAGVDCSDHEVNIKIFLNYLCDHSKLTMEERDQLLVNMTDEVAGLVLSNCKKQNLALSVAARMLPEHLHLFESFIDWAVTNNLLNRELEFLPSSEELRERVAIGKSFSRSELAILLSYSKIILQKQILSGNFADNPSANDYVYRAFPASMVSKFGKQLETHPLRKEIIATQLSTDFVQSLGITFIPEVLDETGISVEEILTSYLFIKEFYDYSAVIKCIEKNEDSIPHDLYMKIWANVRLLMRRSTRWVIRNRRIDPAKSDLLSRYKNERNRIAPKLAELATGQPKKLYQKMLSRLEGYDIAKKDREMLAGLLLDFSSLNIIDSAIQYDADVVDISKVHFLVFDKMKTDLLRIATSYNNFSSRWSVISRFKIKGIIDELQRDLTGIFYTHCYESNIENCLNNIEVRHAELLQSWQRFSVLLQPDARLDFEVIYVMISELQKLRLDLVDYYKGAKVDG